MKFVVVRTGFYDVQPCEEAVLEKGYYVDRRTCKTPEEYDEKFKEKWTSKGENHRILPTGIARDFPTDFWAVELNTLNELLLFIQKYSQVVITSPSEHVYRHPGEVLFSIEIYDGWRE